MNFLRLVFPATATVVLPVLAATILTLNVKPAEGEQAEETEIQRSSIETAERTIQIPTFEKGKFSGYADVPLDPDRRPQAVEEPTAEPLQAPQEFTVPNEATSP